MDRKLMEMVDDYNRLGLCRDTVVKQQSRYKNGYREWILEYGNFLGSGSTREEALRNLIDDMDNETYASELQLEKEEDEEFHRGI